MEKNIKKLFLKGALLAGFAIFLTVLFRFPIDYFHLFGFRMSEATRIFSKSDAIKVVALAGIFFVLYYRKVLAKISHPKQSSSLSILGVLLGTGIVAFYYYLRLISNTTGAPFLLVYLLSIITLVSAAFILATAFFGHKYLKSIYAKLKHPLGVWAIFTVLAYNLLIIFQQQWKLFSDTITIILAGLFQIAYATNYWIIDTPILDVAGFRVAIGAPCSGIESLFLFAAFSIGIFVLDHERLHKRNYTLISILGLVGIYFVNILRLFLLILTGIYISPEFAVGMFHTNVGWLLFVIYFLAYYWLVKRFIYKRRLPKKKLGR